MNLQEHAYVRTVAVVAPSDSGTRVQVNYLQRTGPNAAPRRPAVVTRARLALNSLPGKEHKGYVCGRCASENKQNTTAIGHTPFMSHCVWLALLDSLRSAFDF